MQSIQTHHRAVVAAAAAVVLPLSLGAAHQVSAGAAVPRASASGASGPVGPGCSSLPKGGAGSIRGMARTPLATAAATNPQLTTLAAAAKKAGLTDTLNKARNTTLFAPTNAAFKKVPGAQLTKLLGDGAQLKKVLTYHVVGKEITPNELPHGSFTTKEGSKLTTSGSGQSFKVNGKADVVCGNIKTANGTVYLINSVLTPPH